jgi:hypothetical protein
MSIPPTRHRLLIERAKLVGAYRRRERLEHRGVDVAEADARIAELEAGLPDDVLADAREIAPRSHRAAF